jgi:hypothetical protein
MKNVPMRSAWPSGVNKTMRDSEVPTRSSIQRWPGPIGLVGDHLEPEQLGIEGERASLVAGGYRRT